MSRSNNHHCTPDTIGKQKGEKSPFFHIMNKKDLQNILLNTESDTLFFSEGALAEFSTFFHKEKRELCLSEAKKALSMRQATAIEIEACASKLSEALAELSERLAEPPKAKEVLLKSCAALTEFVSSKETEIRTNILAFANKTLINLEQDNTFLHVQKELFFCEAVQKHLGILPTNWEQTKQHLLDFPPKCLISRLSGILKRYEESEKLLASQLALAVKAARAQNAEKYINILHETTRYLYDIASRLN